MVDGLYADGAPAEPRRPFRILVVCTANICRSPLAEHLLRATLTAASGSGGGRFEVSSAGVRGWDGAEMDPPAAAELSRLGGDAHEFRARLLTDDLCEAVDLILTATLEHRAYVLQEVPRALNRTFTLLEFAHLVSEIESVRSLSGSPVELVKRAALARGAATLEQYDIPDPYGAETEVHSQTADVIHAAVETIVPPLAGQHPASTQTAETAILER